MKILYTAHATATGGRTGEAKSSDGQLTVKLVTVKELGGPGGDGTNPEQLFAAGYSACFLSALKLVAGQQKKSVPATTSISADVGIGPQDSGVGFGLAVTLNVSIPGMDREEAQKLVEATHQVCPYSNATRGNVDVKLVIV
ncbi:MAG: organic hydroperoxide resistance protein [Parvibaculum sp.]|uniref:organic hydroperoxide resistance protein n=1 Tax=Parvibaculum sp. TaxID=2024848 RepID=UPI0025E01874|nr:organic hydroperoxide resistance protein [Parvibaculum sp.]MCE9649476.1 organic hydroperoxide resistance protein [Parvibaculum sp.]